ncbi:MAG: MFS transporter [Deltaproteobacteria bacterium]|nr:MFS transporter [Deltaproteobacteria bacterium]
MSYSSKHLIADRRFGPVFWTQFFGAFNDNLLRNALAILIIMKSLTVGGLSSSQMVALCGGIFILPFFLFSATAGQLADKVSKSRLIFWVKVWEVALMILASCGFLWESLPILLIALFMTGLQSTFFGPVKYSVLPQLLQDDELLSATAQVEMGTFFSILLGTVVGGLLMGIPREGPWLVGLVIIGCSVLGCLASSVIRPIPPVAPQLRIQWNPIPPTMEIMKLTYREESIFLAILVISWFWFLGSAFLSLLPPFCKEFLQADESVITLFLALFSIGIGLGSLLCGRLSRDRVELGLVPTGGMGMSFFAFDLFLAGRPEMSAAGSGGISVAVFLSTFEGLRIAWDLFLFSICGGIVIVPLYTFLQRKPDPAERSRIVAGNNIVNSIFMVAAAILLVGLFEVGCSISSIFLFLAVINLGAVIPAYRAFPDFFLRFLCWLIANFMYRLQVTGTENIPSEGPAVLVSNHVSFVDWLLIASACPRPVRFVMHYKFFEIRLMRRFFRDGKVIPIAGIQENPQILREAFLQITEELRRGQIVCLFPEGRITRDGTKRKFRPGVEWIVRKFPAPVIPIALNGLWGSFFSRKYGRPMSKPFRRFWSRIAVAIGKPVPPHEVSAERLHDLVSELQGE